MRISRRIRLYRNYKLQPWWLIFDRCADWIVSFRYRYRASMDLSYSDSYTRIEWLRNNINGPFYLAFYYYIETHDVRLDLWFENQMDMFKFKLIWS